MGFIRRSGGERVPSALEAEVVVHMIRYVQSSLECPFFAAALLCSGGQRWAPVGANSSRFDDSVLFFLFVWVDGVHLGDGG